MSATKHFHPRPDEGGTPVLLRHPSTPTTPATWLDPAAVATVVPDGPLPPRLLGVDLSPAVALPTDVAGWEALAAAGPVFEEPPYPAVATLRAAAGVAIEERDGRVWLVAPSNAFGGYASTLPKGRVDPGLSLRATAVKEALEETGLLVQLTGFLLDCRRTNTLTRYYRALAQRPSFAKVIEDARPYRHLFPLPWPEDFDRYHGAHPLTRGCARFPSSGAGAAR